MSSDTHAEFVLRAYYSEERFRSLLTVARRNFPDLRIEDLQECLNDTYFEFFKYVRDDRIKALIGVPSAECLKGRTRYSVTAWLRRTLKRMCVRSVLRSRRRRKWEIQTNSPLSEPQGRTVPEARVLKEEQSAGLNKLVHSRLDDDEQEILHLKYAVGMTYCEIAQLKSMKQGAVQSKHFRAMEKLRQDPDEGILVIEGKP